MCWRRDSDVSELLMDFINYFPIQGFEEIMTLDLIELENREVTNREDDIIILSDEDDVIIL